MWVTSLYSLTDERELLLHVFRMAVDEAAPDCSPVISFDFLAGVNRDQTIIILNINN